MVVLWIASIGLQMGLSLCGISEWCVCYCDWTLTVLFFTGGGRRQFEEDAADGAGNSQWDIQRQQHQNT